MTLRKPKQNVFEVCDDLSQEERQELMRRGARLELSAAELFAGQDPRAVGLALGLLTATWLRGHYDPDGDSDRFREKLLAAHSKGVKAIMEQLEQLEQSNERSHPERTH